MYLSCPWAVPLAKNLVNGDLVSRRVGAGELYIVIGFTYRVSRWGNRRIMKLFCSATGKLECVLEEQLVVISPANSEKKS
jgi:hypothetical protein